MIKFSASTATNLEQINEWRKRDSYHLHQNHPEWWLTGAKGSLLAFCLTDAQGPLTFVRLEEEGEYVRIHTQFAPESIVSKRRLVVGMIECMKVLIGIYKTTAKGMIFDSESPTLIAFMDKHFGFKSVGGKDYRLDFGV